MFHVHGAEGSVHIKMTNLPQLMYKFNVIHIKITTGFFFVGFLSVLIDKEILILVGKSKTSRIAKMIF